MMNRHRIQSTEKRGSATRERWDNARDKQKAYFELTGEQRSKKEFFKNDNVLDNRIVVYDVSAQTDYNSGSGGMYTQGKTFQVIMFRDFDDTTAITDKTKRAYESMAYDGDSFNPNFQQAISEHTNVKPEEVRGLEVVRGANLTREDYMNLAKGGAVTKGLDKTVSFSKKKKGALKGNYTAQLDLSEF